MKKWPKPNEIKEGVDFVNNLQEWHLNRFFKLEDSNPKSAFESLNNFNKIRRNSCQKRHLKNCKRLL